MAFAEAGGRVFLASGSQVETVDLAGPSSASSLLLAFGTVALLHQSVSIAIMQPAQGMQSLEMVVLRPGVPGACIVSLPQSALGPLDYAPAKSFLTDGPFLVAQATRRSVDRAELVVVHSLQSSAAFQQSPACYALGSSETLAGAVGLLEAGQQLLLLHIYDVKIGAHRWLLHSAEGGGSGPPLARFPASALGDVVTAVACSSGLIASISADGAMELRTLKSGAAAWLEGAAESAGHAAARGQLQLEQGFRAQSAHLLAADTRPTSSTGLACEAGADQPPADAAPVAEASLPVGILLVLASDSSGDGTSGGGNSTLFLVSLADLSVLYELRGVACYCTGPLLHPLTMQVLLGAVVEGDLSFALLTLPGQSGAAWAVGPLPRAPAAGPAMQWQALQTGMGAVSVPLLLKKLAKVKGRKRKAPHALALAPTAAQPDGSDGEPDCSTPGQRDLASALLRQMQLAQGGMLRAQAAVRRAWGRLCGLRAGELDSLCASHTLLFASGGSVARPAARDGGRGRAVRVLALRHSGPGAAAGSVSLHAHVVNAGALPLLALRLGAFALPAADAGAAGSGCDVQTRGDLVPVLLPQESAWIHATCQFPPCPLGPDLSVCLRYRQGAAYTGLDRSRMAFEGGVGDGAVGAAGEEGRVVGVVVGGRPSSLHHLRSTRLAARDLPAIATAATTAGAAVAPTHRKASLRTAAVLLFDELRALAVTHRVSRSLSFAPHAPPAAAASVALTPSLRADPDRATGLLMRQLRSDLALACALREVS